MCKYCFETEYYEFKTELDFEKFSKEFDSKIEKTIQFVKNENSDYRMVDIYICKYCKQLWWLSETDNHWRGYFLKEKNAKNHLKRNLNDPRSWGCVFLIIVLLIVLIKSFFNKMAAYNRRLARLRILW